MPKEDNFLLPLLTTIAITFHHQLAVLLGRWVPMLVAEGISVSFLLLASGSLAIILRRSSWRFGKLILLSVALGIVAFIFAWLIPSW